MRFIHLYVIGATNKAEIKSSIEKRVVEYMLFFLTHSKVIIPPERRARVFNALVLVFNYLPFIFLLYWPHTPLASTPPMIMHLSKPEGILFIRAVPIKQFERVNHCLGLQPICG